MRARVAIGALIALLVLVSIFLAAHFGGSAHQVDAGESPANETLIAELRQLARSQERTAAALEHLEEVLADRLDVPAPAMSARHPLASAPGPESFDYLIASLDALRATFEAESGRTRELIRSAPAFGGESLREIRGRSAGPNWIALDELERSWRTDGQQANRSQYLQTARDLLEAYGPPSAIYRPQGGILFVYRRHAEGEAGPAWYFRIQDGIVVEFFLEDEERDDAPQ